MKDEADENGKSGKDDSSAEEKKVKAAGEEAESIKAIGNNERSVDLHLDLEKSERDGGDGVNAAGNGNKSQSLTQKQQQPLTEKSGRFPFLLLLFKFECFLILFFVLWFRSFHKLLAIANVHGKLAWWASSDGVRPR